MKTIEDIKSAIAFIGANLNPRDEDREERAFLKRCLFILESNPTEDFLKREHEKVTKAINEMTPHALSGFLPGYDPVKLGKLKKQESILRFIIS